jgi:hypothetical protein
MKASVWAVILLPVLVYLYRLFMAKVPDGKFKRFLLYDFDSVYVNVGFTVICIAAVIYAGYLVLG